MSFVEFHLLLFCLTINFLHSYLTFSAIFSQKRDQSMTLCRFEQGMCKTRWNKTKVTNVVLIILTGCIYSILLVFLFLSELQVLNSPLTSSFHPHSFHFQTPFVSSLSSSSLSSSPPFSSVPVLVASPECAVSNQAVHGCLSVTHQLSALGDKQSKAEEG